MIGRRSLLAAVPALGMTAAPALGMAAAPALGAAGKILRVGYQKGAIIFMAAKQNRSLEQLFDPQGVKVQWAEFEYGPPLLEATRVGSIDIASVGDTPPIFAQVARANLLYVAAEPSGASGILLPPGSALKHLQDLKGKRIGFARGSSSHNLTVAALEKAGIAYADVQPLYLAPSDAAAAFLRGGIDAWTIWDPYYAIHEVRPGVRVLAKASDITPQNSFLMARQAYVEAHADIIGKAVAEFARVGEWAAAHQPEVVKLVSDATGVPPDAMLRTLRRNPLKILPMSEDYARSQQVEADRFHRLGLIPTAIDVRKEIWHAGA